MSIQFLQLGSQTDREIDIKVAPNKNKFKFDIYKVKVFRIYQLEKSDLIIFSNAIDTVISFFLLAIIYCFVALEEADFQTLKASKGVNILDVESDEWSLWKLFK